MSSKVVATSEPSPTIEVLAAFDRAVESSNSWVCWVVNRCMAKKVTQMRKTPRARLTDVLAVVVGSVVAQMVPSNCKLTSTERL